MSPSSSSRKKRRRLIVSAVTANGAGAVAGVAAQAAISDPFFSALVAAFVAGVVGDLLLQVTRTRNGALGDAARPGEHGRAGRRELDNGHGGDDRAARHKTGDGNGRASGARPGCTRCTRPSRQDAHPAAPRVSPSEAVMTPRHLYHRHLHRGAKRFTRRVHERNARHGLRQPRGTHGAS
ncbi:hypothetical protein Save01_05646 [Streptomyces avermitilis]